MFDLFGNKEKETLYVIGNGFDIHHGIESRYSDFQKYLYKTGQSYLAGQIETFYPKIVDGSKDSKWGDLEKALGAIDVEGTYNECNEDIEIDYDHMMRTAAILEDNPQQTLESSLYDLQKYFEEWVNSIDIEGVEQDESIYQFSASGKFLNFNYTETLESTYKVPRKSITYIHGRRGGNEELILGHNTEIDPHEYSGEEGNTVYEDNAYEGIIRIANEKRKNVGFIISSKKEFWDSIANVERVITYGHSLSDVDVPYFEEIRDSISPCAEWHFGCYSQEDKDRANWLANKLGINKSRFCCFDF